MEQGLKYCKMVGCLEKNPQPFSNFVKHKTSKDKLNSYCKSCIKINSKKYYNDHKHEPRIIESKWKNRGIINKSGNFFTVEDFKKLLSNSNYSCFSCGSKEKLSLDHDHKTGIGRGVLCKVCNCVLGLINEDISVLKKMIEYLEVNKNVNV